LLRQAPLCRVGPGAIRRVFARPFELDFSIHTYTARTGACLEFLPRRHGIDAHLHQSEGGMVGDLAETSQRRAELRVCDAATDGQTQRSDTTCGYGRPGREHKIYASDWQLS
jgi:hypothetical protein